MVKMGINVQDDEAQIKSCTKQGLGLEIASSKHPRKQALVQLNNYILWFMTIGSLSNSTLLTSKLNQHNQFVVKMVHTTLLNDYFLKIWGTRFFFLTKNQFVFE